MSKKKLYLNPKILKFILKGLFKKKEVKSNRFHLEKGMEWLQYTYSNSKSGGISGGYSLLKGWKIPNPGISGGLISTLIEYGVLYDDENYFKMAKKIASWLCSIQLEDGSFQFEIIDNEETIISIFGTGLILSGLIDIFRMFKDKLYKKSIINIGNYLVKNIQPDGAWNESQFNDLPYSYNIMTSWALLRLYLITKNLKYKRAAVKNIIWTYKQKQEDFWFEKMSPISNENPSLHFILYIARGFLECGLILEKEYLSRVTFEIIDKISQHFTDCRKLPMNFDRKWRGTGDYIFHTDIAQLSILLLRLHETYDIKKYLITAMELNDYLKSMQIIRGKTKKFDGAIKSSDPLRKGYAPFEFLSSTTKFFCDALMLERKCY